MTLQFYYHPICPPSRAVLVLADLLNIKLDKKIIKLDLQEHLTPEFIKINPNKSVPVLIDDGKIIRESRAILTYLINQYSPDNKLYPADPYKRSQIDSALFFVACHIYGPFEPIIVGLKLDKFLDNKYAVLTINKNLNKLNDLLANQQFVAGDEFSVADISYLLSLTSIDLIRLFDLTKFKNIMAWKERVKPLIPNYEEVIVNASNTLSEYFDSLKN